MNRISIIRFATYGVLVAIVVLSQNQLRLIPVALSDAEMRDAAVEAELQLKSRVEEVERIANSPGFLVGKRSGTELLGIASRAATEYGAKLSEFHRPEVKVRMPNGRLKWRFLFVRDYGPGVAVAPAEMLSVTIDDETGATAVKDETATM